MGKTCSIFRHGLEDGSMFITLSDDIRLGGVAGTWENRVRVQNDLKKLESTCR